MTPDDFELVLVESDLNGLIVRLDTHYPSRVFQKEDRGLIRKERRERESADQHAPNHGALGGCRE